MIKVNNSEVLLKLREIAQIQQGRDETPDTLGPQIIATMEVNPKLAYDVEILSDASSTVTGTVTAYTTPSDADFYLTGVCFSFIKDAANDAVTGHIGPTVVLANGATKSLTRVAIFTLTAQNESVNIDFNRPIKLARGSAISTNTTFAAGAMSRFLGIRGFIMRNSQG